MYISPGPYATCGIGYNRPLRQASHCARTDMATGVALLVLGEVHLKAWQVGIDGDPRSGFVAEQWGSQRITELDVHDANGVVDGVRCSARHLSD